MTEQDKKASISTELTGTGPSSQGRCLEADLSQLTSSTKAFPPFPRLVMAELVKTKPAKF